MRIAAGFEKVSFEQFRTALNNVSEEEALRIYEGIELPKRATKASAGYDFKAPYDVEIAPGEEVLIPTGIRAYMPDDYVLMLFPRSGLGFKYRLQLNNTVGVIDADYYHAKNEGHIMVKLTNDTHADKTISLKASEGMVQGIFLSYGVTIDDEADGERVGGFGSTTKKE